MAGRIEKIVPIDTLASMFDEPSSGSMATTRRRARIERERIGELFGDEDRDGGLGEGFHEQLVGQKVEGLLHVAVGILGAAQRHRLGRQRAQRDLGGDLGRRPRDDAHRVGDRRETAVRADCGRQIGVESSLGLPHVEHFTVTFSFFCPIHGLTRTQNEEY